MSEVLDGMETTLMSRYMVSVMGSQVASRAPTFNDDDDDIHSCLDTAYDLAQINLEPLPHGVRDYSALATSCTIGAIAIDDVQCANHPETRFMMGKYQRGGYYLAQPHHRVLAPILTLQEPRGLAVARSGHGAPQVAGVHVSARIRARVS
jgi:hypothetical protein